MKTLYVPKGKTLHYERLECQTIIADGTLVVDGAVSEAHHRKRTAGCRLRLFSRSLCSGS